MARARVTTIRLGAEDVAALARARREGKTATELLRRGLRIVGARYYENAGHARLGPADPDTPVARQWLRERAAFERIEARHDRRYEGRWIAVLGGRIVAVRDDCELAVRAAEARAGGRAFFVGRVGHAPDVVEMTGFEVERG